MKSAISENNVLGGGGVKLAKCRRLFWKRGGAFFWNAGFRQEGSRGQKLQIFADVLNEWSLTKIWLWHNENKIPIIQIQKLYAQNLLTCVAIGSWGMDNFLDLDLLFEFNGLIY